MQHDRTPPWYIGAGFLICGVLGYFGEPSRGVPPIVAYGIVTLFVIAGIVLLLWSFGIPNAEKWLGRTVLVGLAGAFTWAGFLAGDDVQCRITTQVFAMTSASTAGPCSKAPFVVLAVVADLYLIYAVIYEFRMLKRR